MNLHPSIKPLYDNIMEQVHSTPGMNREATIAMINGIVLTFEGPEVTVSLRKIREGLDALMYADKISDRSES